MFIFQSLTEILQITSPPSLINIKTILFYLNMSKSHLGLCWAGPSCWRCEAGRQTGSCSWIDLLWENTEKCWWNHNFATEGKKNKHTKQRRKMKVTRTVLVLHKSTVLNKGCRSKAHSTTSLHNVSFLKPHSEDISVSQLVLWLK